MNKQRIIANLAIMGTGQVATWLMSTLSLVLLSRYFGPSRLGELTVASAVVSILGLMGTIGMDPLLIRTIARGRERAGALVSAAVLARVLLAIPAVFILVAYTIVAHYNAETRLII